MTASPTDIPLQSSQVLAGERLAFTGVLASMTHRQAWMFVEQHGGTPTEHVSRLTSILVVGEEGWPLEPDGQPSVKFQQAMRMIQEGHAVRIVRESEWLGFIGLKSPSDEVRNHYTPAMLSQMLSVPVNAIRSWERSGLIRPVERVGRLPYFDFEEAANVRRLIDLLDAGISRRQIAESLHALSGVVGDVRRPLAQLELLADPRELGYRDRSGQLKTLSGQRLFDFEQFERESDEDGPPAIVPLPPPEAAAQTTAAECLDEGCRLSDRGHLSAAAELFRRGLRADPADASLRFHLAETLYRLGNTAGALEQYRTAVEFEPDYIEAWTQLGCVAAELHDDEAAIAAFQAALESHDDCPDAHFHLAQVLAECGRVDEAVRHWERYLEFDRRGPWAAAARERLAEALGRESGDDE